MKEIVVVTPHLGNGGAERVLSELMSEWTRMGKKISVIQTNANRYGNDYEFSQKINVINLTTTGGKFRRAKQALELCKILSKYPDATVVSFVNTAILVCGIASFIFKNKLIFSERCDPARTPDKKIQRIVRDKIFKRADACVFQTTMARKHFPKSVQRKGVIIKNPINPLLPEPYRGIRKKTIIAACQLTDQKNIPMLIHAFAKFYESNKDYRLEIYGRGVREAELRELIKTLGLENHAFLMGFSDDIYKQMKDCAMYVSSSDYEGISNAMLEALGLGLPSICTDCPVGGPREIIEDGINGLLVPVGDAEALCEAMKKIADDSAFAERLSENAVKVRDKFAISEVAREWLQLMDRIE